MKKTVHGYIYYLYPPQLVIFKKLRDICQRMPAYKGMVRNLALRGGLVTSTTSANYLGLAIV